jgi:hypothetical protein
MSIDHEKLAELAQTLTDDQRRLLREGLGTGENVDAEGLGAALRSFDSEAMFERLAVSAHDVPVTVDAGPDGGAPGTGTPDGGLPNGGGQHPTPVPPEPPLTRW